MVLLFFQMTATKPHGLPHISSSSSLVPHLSLSGDVKVRQ